MPSPQAHPPSENQQLEDARIAMEQAIVRITELERQLASYRKQYSLLTAERDRYGQAVLNAAGDYAELERAAQAVIDSTHFYRSLDGAPWIATGRAQLDALSRCVSSNQAETGTAQSEETQAVRERLAAYAHEAWSAYMDYFLGKCEPQTDGALLIAPGYVAALRKQIATPYADLSAVEQGYDLAEADKMLAIFHS